MHIRLKSTFVHICLGRYETKLYSWFLDVIFLGRECVVLGDSSVLVKNLVDMCERFQIHSCCVCHSQQD